MWNGGLFPLYHLSLTKEVLKIKETFSSLYIKKIKNIQKIIKDNNKTKLRLHIMTEGLSKKQVINPISSDNSKRFMIDLSAHITNINRALKNIKSDIKVDFV